MALAWFTLRAVATIAGPALALTGFMAYAPRILGAHQIVIVAMSIGLGFVGCYPRQWSVKAALLRGVYVWAMLIALAWWMFFAAGMYFPEAWMQLGLGRDGPGPFP
jgi:hypothetical protein